MRLSVETVKNIEEGNYDELPEPVYIRGHVRSYCGLLKIDPAPVLELFSERTESDWPGSESRTTPSLVDEHTQYLIRVWGSILVLAIVGFVLVARWAERGSFSAMFGQIEEPPAVIEVEEPVAEPAVEPLPQPEEIETVDLSEPDIPLQTTPAVVELDAVEPDAVEPATGEPAAEVPEVVVTIATSGASWARIYGEDGENIVHRMLPPGYRKDLTVQLPLHLELGDARNVRLWLNDAEYDLTRHSSSLNTAFFSIERLPQAE